MSSFVEFSEIMAAILIGVLVSLCLSAFLMIIFILHRKARKGVMKIMKKIRKPKITLLKSPKLVHRDSSSSDTSFIDELYESMDAAQDDPQWADTASSVITHCMAVLVNCRALTEKLTAIAMSMLDEWDPQMNHLVEIAKMITLRVDQLVGSMYPPFNAQELQARAASLTLAVSHLALITQYECHSEKIPMEWISKLLRNTQKHIDMINSYTETNFHNSRELYNGPTITPA